MDSQCRESAGSDDSSGSTGGSWTCPCKIPRRVRPDGGTIHRFHEKVAQGYRDLAALAPERIVTIDATQDIDTIHAAIVDNVEKTACHKVGWSILDEKRICGRGL